MSYLHAWSVTFVLNYSYYVLYTYLIIFFIINKSRFGRWPITSSFATMTSIVNFNEICFLIDCLLRTFYHPCNYLFLSSFLIYQRNNFDNFNLSEILHVVRSVFSKEFMIKFCITKLLFERILVRRLIVNIIFFFESFLVRAGLVNKLSFAGISTSCFISFFWSIWCSN